MNDQKVTRVGVYETSVFGVKAYHTRCLECGKETKRRDKESQAVKDAKKHVCKE